MSRPVPCPHPFPFRTHRTMAQVIRQEELDAWHRRPQAKKSLTMSAYGKAREKYSALHGQTAVNGWPPEEQEAV